MQVEACGHFGIDHLGPPLDGDSGGAPVASGGGNFSGLGDGGTPSGSGGLRGGGGRLSADGGSEAGGAMSTGGADERGGAMSTGGASSVGGAMSGGAESGGTDGSGGADESGGAGGNGGSACSSGTFATWEKIDTLDVSGEAWSPSVTADGLILMFSVSNQDGERIYESRRTDRSLPFGKAELRDELNQADRQATPFLNAAGTRVYFSTQTGTDTATRDLWWASRPTKDDPFSGAKKLTELNSTARDQLPWLSVDELTIYFTSSRNTDAWLSDIWRASRTTLDAPFSNIERARSGSQATEDGSPTLTPDGLTMFFSSDRNTSFDIFQVARSTEAGAFQTPSTVETLISSADEINLHLSPDGRQMYFSSSRDGPTDLYVSERSCP